MENLKYYRLESSSDIEEIGDIFAKSVYQIHDFIDPDNNTEERFEKYSDFSGCIDEELDLTKFAVMSQAKITDLLSARFFWHKCFYSADFITLSKKFTLENSKIIPCKVHHENDTYDYFLLELLRTLSIVDFEKSEFTIFDDIAEEPKYIYKDKITETTYFDVLRKIAKDSDYELTMKPTKVVLNRPSDLFFLRLDNGFYISNQFKEAIEKEKLTGFEFSERPLKFEFYKNW
ncbi:hypothetical protein [uncultured Kordia sp.]|uniref:imm11 family protein n=1 Tax=uncultured Kordia sp. TaxID=507699 RepID=UPI002630439F|nr:hypothetical protein [uncultured Kordia sp.]